MFFSLLQGSNVALSIVLSLWTFVCGYPRGTAVSAQIGTIAAFSAAIIMLGVR